MGIMWAGIILLLQKLFQNRLYQVRVMIIICMKAKSVLVTEHCKAPFDFQPTSK